MDTYTNKDSGQKKVIRSDEHKVRSEVLTMPVRPDVYGFDTETTPFKDNQTPLFKLFAVFGFKTLISSKPTEIKQFFTSLTNSSVFVAHNLSFDWFVLNQAYDFKEFKITKINISGRPNFIILKRDTHLKGSKLKLTITFIGLENFIEGKLDKIAKAFNAPEKLNCDLSLTPNNPKLRKYCLRDAEICYTVFNTHFFCVDRRNRVKISIPSIAYQELLNSIPANTINPKRSNFIKIIEQNSYYGGRNEIFNYRYKKCNLYDVNSLYPYSMSIAKIPTSYAFIKSYPKINDVIEISKDNSKTYIISAKVFLSKPVLPVKIKGKLIFPVGEIDGYWSEPEFNYALPYLRIIKLKLLIVYNAILELFRPFIIEKYNQRLTYPKDSPLNLITKLKMNSSYGKFAQRFKESKELTKEELNEVLVDGGDYFDKDGKLWRYRHIGNKWIKEYSSRKEAFGKFTAIASIITSQARVILNKLLFDDKPKVAYCDCDSLFTPKLLQTSKNLGDIKLEGSGNLKIYALKFYKFKSILKSKGIPKNHTLISENDKELVFSFDKVVKLYESVKQNLKPYQLKQNIKCIHQQYDKGYVVNGKVFPLVMLNGKILNHYCDNLNYLKEHWGEFID